MMPFLPATAAAPAISLSSPAASTALLAIIAALLGFALWFLQREIRNNDKAHQELKADIKSVEADVKQLLAGQSRIEGLLEGLIVQGKLDGVKPITPPTSP
ncbi:MAG: hypothetical protein OXG35_22655 [Acidobacteria bacterium]|nr:hypothetical protein [Acidobacteriota bacterium]